MLSVAERHKYILDHLNKYGFVRITDVANELGVTKVTIRKDVKILESKGLLYKVHGSARPANPHVADLDVHVKDNINRDAKRLIAQRAVELLDDNDSIIIASGSTIYAFAEEIKMRQWHHLNIVTPFLRLGVLLNEAENVNVVQLGGTVHKKSLSVLGEEAARSLDDCICSKLFFGVDGMDGILDMPGFDVSLAEGLVLMTPFCATVESSKSFVDAYTAAYGTTPNQFAADAYDGVYIVKAALEQAGCTADMSNEEICDALVSAITSLKFTGLTGTDMSWNAEGQVSKAPTAYVVKDGQYVEG
mgnify:CR=1 FL=1